MAATAGVKRGNPNPKRSPGRPVGSKNKSNAMYGFVRERVYEQYKVLPIDYFMQVLNTPIGAKDQFGDKITKADRHEAAKAAAPYLHQKLATIEVSGPQGGAINYSIDVKKLSDEELHFFEQIMLRAALPELTDDRATIDLEANEVK